VCDAAQLGADACRCSYFGQEGTAYDFAKHNMNEVRRSCKKLEEQQSGMKKKVNPKVLNMIDR
jgi:structural maintenance of chromosome 2